MAKSNFTPLPVLDKRGEYSHFQAAIDRLRSGNTFMLLSELRALLARKLAALLLPRFDCAKYFGSLRVDVVDVGAAGGLHRRWHPFLGNIHAHLFDPEPDALKGLSEAAGGASTVYPFALSRDEKPVSINIMAWPRASGVFLPDPDFLEKTTLRHHLKPVSSIEFQAKAMDSVVAHADFIKIDVEGFELAILQGSERLLQDTLGLELEVTFLDRLVPDKPLFGEIDAWCRERGFRLVKFFDAGDLHYALDDRRYEIGGVLYGANALYVRLPHDLVDGIRVGRWPFEAIWKAVLIYLAYDQLELAWTLTQAARGLDLAADQRVRLEQLTRGLDSYAGRLPSRRVTRSLIGLLGNPE